MEFSAQQIATYLQGTVDGNPDAAVKTFAKIEEGVEGAIAIANADKAWIYTADGKLVEFVQNPTTVAVEAGVYLVKMQLGNVIRNAKVLVK